MNTNWKEPQETAPPDPDYKSPPFVKSPREIRINQMCESLLKAVNERDLAIQKVIGRALLDFIEE